MSFSSASSLVSPPPLFLVISPARGRAGSADRRGARQVRRGHMEGRPRRHARGRAPEDPGRRPLLEDSLLRRQGAAAGTRLRRLQALRGRFEQATQEGPRPRPRRVSARCPRRPPPGDPGRPGRHRDGVHHDHAGATEGGRLFGTDLDQRLRDRRDGAGRAPGRDPRGPLGTRGLHPEGIVLRREHPDAQRRAEEGREAARPGPLRARQPGGRGHPGDGQRRPRPVDDRRRHPGPILEAGLPEDHAQPGRRGPNRRAVRLDDPQEQPAAEEGARRIPRALPRRLRDAQPAPREVPEEHEVREERHLHGGTRQVQRGRRALSQVLRRVRHGLPC